MDNQALWNRMDHLERIILEQGKEIDRLKQIVSNYSRHKNSSSLDENTPTQVPSALHQSPNCQSAKQQTPLLNPSIARLGASQRNSLHMSSYVHPQSAVPPFARWPTDSNHQDNESSDSASPADKNQGLIEVLTCFCPCFGMC